MIHYFCLIMFMMTDMMMLMLVISGCCGGGGAHLLAENGICSLPFHVSNLDINIFIFNKITLLPFITKIGHFSIHQNFIWMTTKGF